MEAFSGILGKANGILNSNGEHRGWIERVGQL